MRKRLAVGALVLVVLFGAVTLVALEGKDVAVLHTIDDDGTARATRVWVAEADGALWVESATPERPFYRSLGRDPHLEVEHGGERFEAVATLVPNPDGHRRIRQMLRDKYGWADAYVALLQDTSGSLAVRLQRR